MRAKERIKARAAQRHKARDIALPFGQRPVKWLWFMTVIFSVNMLFALFSTWRHHSVLLGLLRHPPAFGSISFQAGMWYLLSVFNALMFPALLVSMWARIF